MALFTLGVASDSCHAAVHTYASAYVVIKDSKGAPCKNQYRIVLAPFCIL